VAPTGDEVVPLGRPLGPGQVYDSNAAGVQALVCEAGGRAEHAGIMIDRLDALVSLLRQAEFDLVVTIGGTSVGRRDLVSEAMGQVGETLVHGVAVKPGKPLLLGRVEGRTVVGLPGFPTSCMMQAYAVVAPMVRTMARLPIRQERRRATLTHEVSSPAGKVQLRPVSLEGEAATPTFRMSSAISSIAHAQGWIEVPATASSLSAGSEVEVRLF
jgi:molybdopterin molybdotransferase